jgi:hypothetical protein
MYRPLFRKLKDQIIALTEPLPMPDLPASGHRLATFAYIQAHGLYALSRVPPTYRELRRAVEDKWVGSAKRPRSCQNVLI